MELNTAITLIKTGTPHRPIPQTWADLGAGSGLFTKALSTLLPDGSTVYEVDQDAKALNSIKLPAPQVTLIKITMDFVNEVLNLEPLDGILMANALHFVKEKDEFLSRLRNALKPSAAIIIVEYDRDTSNSWVPYPMSFQSLQLLASRMSFKSISKIGSTPSRYSEANIYSALVEI